MLEGTCGDKGEDDEVKGFPHLKESGGLEIGYCVSGVKELKPLNCSWATATSSVEKSHAFAKSSRRAAQSAQRRSRSFLPPRPALAAC